MPVARTPSTNELLTAPAIALFNTVPLPALLVDADSLRVLAANAAAEERYGYPPAALRALRLTDLIDPYGSPRLIARRELPTGETLTIERHRHCRNDGTVFPVHCATREFTLGKQRLLMLVVTELSELGALDAEERFIEKLEAMARLSGGIAHEFNNLFTAILATTDLALESLDAAAPLRADLQDIHDATQRAAADTRLLMAFSGTLSMSRRPTDINQLLEHLKPLLQLILPSTGELRLELQATGLADIDPARFEQVVLNLVLNASEAMPEGGLVTVRTEDADALVAVIVADQGRGMDETTLARLFEPFHSTKGPTGGRGLGLASVWGTVRQMGGSTEIESGPGGGTRVRMFFPRVIAPVEVEVVSPPRDLDATGGEVVLVVEDEPGVRAPICRALRQRGYFVLEANHGEAAMKVMQEHHAPVHLVITDVMMPEMDGTQLVSLLRSWYPRMRVLFISGYSAQYFEARGGAGRVSGSHFLAKPFGPADLTRRVREILDAEWSEDQ